METRTRQEVFDIVSKHLLTQKERSTNFSDCKYREERDGYTLMCAIGCLIPDDIYQKSMEGCTVVHLAEHYPGIRPFVGMEGDRYSSPESYAQSTFLDKLQKIHDSLTILRKKKELISIAKTYKLEIKPEIFGGESEEEGAEGI